MRPKNLNSFCDFGPDNHGQEARYFFFWGGKERFQGVEKKHIFQVEKMGNYWWDDSRMVMDDPKI